jgi:amino acid permease
MLFNMQACFKYKGYSLYSLKYKAKSYHMHALLSLTHIHALLSQGYVYMFAINFEDNV